MVGNITDMSGALPGTSRSVGQFNLLALLPYTVYVENTSNVIIGYMSLPK